jgi:hypothetical protein
MNIRQASDRAAPPPPPPPHTHTHTPPAAAAALRATHAELRQLRVLLELGLVHAQACAAHGGRSRAQHVVQGEGRRRRRCRCRTARHNSSAQALPAPGAQPPALGAARSSAAAPSSATVGPTAPPPRPPPTRHPASRVALRVVADPAAADVQHSHVLAARGGEHLRVVAGGRGRGGGGGLVAQHQPAWGGEGRGGRGGAPGRARLGGRLLAPGRRAAAGGPPCSTASPGRLHTLMPQASQPRSALGERLDCALVDVVDQARALVEEGVCRGAAGAGGARPLSAGACGLVGWVQVRAAWLPWAATLAPPRLLAPLLPSPCVLPHQQQRPAGKQQRPAAHRGSRRSG